MEEVEKYGERTPEELKAQRERSLKLITVLSIVAIVMLFMGLISAVVVSKMDKFWVNLRLPSAFWTSTVLILISSVTLYLAKVFAKQNKKSLVQLSVGLTLLLGVGFVGYQVKGWAQLVASGNYVTGGVFFQKGAYGEKFIVLKDNLPIEFNGINYVHQGDTLNIKEVDALKEFVYPICQNDRKYIPKSFQLKNYGSPYTIAKVNISEIAPKPLELKDGKFLYSGLELQADELTTLFNFAFGIKNETPYFGMRGVYGEDFTISLNGEVLSLIDRKLYFPTSTISDEGKLEIEAKHFEGGKEYVIKDGKVYSEGEQVQPKDFYFTDKITQNNIFINEEGVWYKMGAELSNGQYNEFYQASNVASSFVYALTFMHALHILIGFGLLSVLLVRSFKGYYHSKHVVGLKIGGYFWHFLGILWLVLFTFWYVNTI